ncbi:MAG: SDR family NAD(P)-dependent oxidoreductase, partial [Methylococcaceae bacterium]
GVGVGVGVGVGNGAAIAHKFSETGHKVALLARTLEFTSKLAGELDDAIAIVCDVTNEQDVLSAFSQVRNQLGVVTSLIYNAGAGSWGTIEEISVASFEANWKVNALGALLSTQQVIPAMKDSGFGNIVFVGATASRRGSAKTAAFSPAKAAQRALAESMARHLWPFGIHVSLLIVDGIINIPSTRNKMPDKNDDFFVNPADIAATIYHLCTQHRSAWSFEVEARPFSETW